MRSDSFAFTWTIDRTRHQEGLMSMLFTTFLRHRPTIYSACLVFALCAITGCDGDVHKNTPHLYDLQCEYGTEPIGIDNPNPRLSWKMHADDFGKEQSAYRILVADSKALLAKDTGNCWDSGKTEHQHSTPIVYEGRTLKTGERLFWKVRVWDEKKVAGPWSAVASWEMGKLSPAQWNAKWIGKGDSISTAEEKTGPAPYFRKAFEVSHDISQARLFISGLGYYVAYINGTRVGDRVLAPAPSNYDRRPLKDLLYFYDDQSTTRVYYNTYDISHLLQRGRNTIGVVLGNGWYNQRDRTVEGKMWYDTPRLIAELTIMDKGTGQSTSVVTDRTWKVTTGSIRHNGIFTGEVHDTRLDLGDWTKPHYDDGTWTSATEVRGPEGKLVSQLAPPDRVIKSVSPASIVRDGSGSYRVDVGEMISGWAALRLQGDPGQKVTMRFIEEMGRDYGQADTFILSGTGTESFVPEFTWHAFRHIEITGVPDLGPEDMSVHIVHTDVDTTGYFRCSNPLFNEIHENYVRTQLGNLHGSFSSDCPHRERLGYTGDGQVIAGASMFAFDLRQFYLKWMDDIEDARNHHTGYVPHTAPFGGGGGGPAWGSAIVIVPWKYYLFYGDTAMLEKHYDAMTHWVKYLGTRTDGDYVVVREEPNGWCLGDWATPDKVEVPPPLVNTAYFYHVTTLVARIAEILGKRDDARDFEALSKKINAAFHTRFYNATSTTYWEGRQGANVFPLAFGMVPEQREKTVAANIARHVISTGKHFDTGIMATPLLLKVLTEYGYDSLAYGLMDQTGFPGFGYYISGKGATSLWENWDGRGSHSHPMFGSVVEWMYSSLAGIQPLAEAPGFKQFVLRPACIDKLDSVKGSFQSVYGEISSAWKTTGGTFLWNISIPPNTAARIYIPESKRDAIYIDGQPAEQHSAVSYVGNEDGYSVYRIGSGNYSIRTSTSG
jgi:alpha-L-rhamnosidase